MSLTGKTIGQLPQYTQDVTGSILFPIEYNGSTYNITQDKLTSSTSASYASTASFAISASYSATASYLLGYISPFPFTGSAQITGSLGVTGSISSTGDITTVGTLTAQTLVVQTITSSIEYSSGSNIFGSQITNTQTMTGSVNITGSLNVTGSSTFNSDVLVGGLTRLLGAGSGNTGYIRLTNNANGSFITFTGTQIRLQDNTTGQLLIGNTNFTVNQISPATAGGAQIAFNQNTSTSGNLIALLLTSSYSQSSGGTANTDFVINRTQTVVGSGSQYLIDARTNNVSQFNVSNVGRVVTNAMYISGSVSGSLYVSGSTSISGSLDSSGVVTFSNLGTGTVSATSGILSTTSDMSLKVEDGYINNALEKVLKLTPRYFHWKEESGLPTDIRQLGFYAQEVNSALGEEAANTPRNETDKWGIYDRGIVAFLTKAIQEQNQTIVSLQDRIIELENK